MSARLRRRAEAAEFALGQRLRDLAYLADLIGVGIIRLTDDLHVEVANTAAHVFLGREARSMIGRTAIEAFLDHRIEEIARAAAERGSASGEVVLGEADGPTLVIRARRSPILGIWLVLEDVAELRRLQRIRAEFIDNLSHELRTPITTVGSARGDARPGRGGRRRRRAGPDARADLEAGGRDGEHRPDDLRAPRPRPDRERRPRSSTSTTWTSGAWRSSPWSGCARSPSDRGSAWRSTSPRTFRSVRGEAARLGQVFANLVHNAVKFSPPDSTVTVLRSIDRRGRGGVGHRPRGRDRGRGPAPDLRAVLQGGPVADVRRRHRPGPGDRPPHRGRPRRTAQR